MSEGKTKSFCLNSFYSLHIYIQRAMLPGTTKHILTQVQGHPCSSKNFELEEIYKKPLSQKQFLLPKVPFVALWVSQIHSSDISVTKTPSLIFARLTMWDPEFWDLILFSADVRAVLFILHALTDLSEI